MDSTPVKYKFPYIIIPPVIYLRGCESNPIIATNYLLQVLSEDDQAKIQGKLLLREPTISKEDWYNQFSDVHQLHCMPEFSPLIVNPSVLWKRLLSEATNICSVHKHHTNINSAIPHINHRGHPFLQATPTTTAVASKLVLSANAKETVSQHVGKSTPTFVLLQSI